MDVFDLEWLDDKTLLVRDDQGQVWRLENVYLKSLIYSDMTSDCSTDCYIDLASSERYDSDGVKQLAGQG